MGVFLEYVQVFNRAPVNINIRFDGQDMELKPGLGTMPVIAVQYGKNQNPVMGTQDPNNPHISGAEYLFGVVGQDNCEPMTKEEWEMHLGRPCRTNEEQAFQDKYGSDPKARQIVLGKGRKTAATSRVEATGSPRGESSFDSRE